MSSTEYSGVLGVLSKVTEPTVRTSIDSHKAQLERIDTQVLIVIQYNHGRLTRMTPSPAPASPTSLSGNESTTPSLRAVRLLQVNSLAILKFQSLIQSLIHSIILFRQEQEQTNKWQRYFAVESGNACRAVANASAPSARLPSSCAGCAVSSLSAIRKCRCFVAAFVQSF